MVACVGPFDAPPPPTKLIGALEKRNARYGMSMAKLSGSQKARYGQFRQECGGAVPGNDTGGSCKRLKERASNHDECDFDRRRWENGSAAHPQSQRLGLCHAVC